MNKVERYRKSVGQTSTVSLELEIEKSKDILLKAPEGYYVDLTSGISVQNMGFSNKKIVEAVHEQVSAYMHTGVYGEHVQTPQVELAEVVAEDFNRRAGRNDYQLFYTNSGTESTELALKAVRKSTGRYKMLAVEGGYHGRTYGAMEVGFRKEYVEGFGVNRSTTFLKRNSYEDLEKIDFSEYAGIILELVQGEAGGYPLDKKWVNRLCTEVGLSGGKTIFDEVQTGFGRTGTLFAQEQYGVVPDFTTLGKAIGGGLPLGGVVAQKHEWEALETPAFSHVSTQAGNPVCCAAGLALVKQVTPEVLEDVRTTGSEFFEELREEIGHSEHIVEIRNLGLIGAIEFSDGETAHKFVEALRKESFIIVGYKLNNPKTIRIAPPLTFASKESEQVRRLVKQQISKASSNLHKIW